MRETPTGPGFVSVAHICTTTLFGTHAVIIYNDFFAKFLKQRCNNFDVTADVRTGVLHEFTHDYVGVSNSVSQ